MSNVPAEGDYAIFLYYLEHSSYGLIGFLGVDELLHELVIVPQEVHNNCEFLLMQILCDDPFPHASAQVQNVIRYLETYSHVIHDSRENLEISI